MNVLERIPPEILTELCYFFSGEELVKLTFVAPLFREIISLSTNLKISILFAKYPLSKVTIEEISCVVSLLAYVQKYEYLRQVKAEILGWNNMIDLHDSVWYCFYYCSCHSKPHLSNAFPIISSFLTGKNNEVLKFMQSFDEIYGDTNGETMIEDMINLLKDLPEEKLQKLNTISEKAL